MKNSLIVESKVKKFFHERGKRIDSEAMIAINTTLEQILERAIGVSRKFRTVTKGEIVFAYRQTAGVSI